MDLQTTVLIVIATYCAIMVLIGLNSGAGKNHENFVIGNRNVGIIPTATSLGVGMRDAAYLAFWIGLSYTNGYSMSLFFFGILGFTLVFSTLGVRFRRVAKERNYITAGQMLEDYIGGKSRKGYSLVILAVGAMFCSAQLYVMGQILSQAVGFPDYITIPVISSVIAFYIFMGGYNSVIKTDFIQFFVLLSLVVAVFMIPVPSSEYLLDWKSFGSFGLLDCSAIILLSLLSSYSSPDTWQRLFSAKDDRTVRIGIPLGAFLFFLSTFVFVYMGLSLRDILPREDFSQLIVSVFSKNAFSTPVLVILLVAIFASGMSTIDTWAYVFSSTVMRDFVGTSTKTNRVSYVSQTRMITFALLFVVTLIAVFSDGLVEILMGFLGIYGVAAPMFMAIMLGIVKEAKEEYDRIFVTSLVISSAVFIFMYVKGYMSAGFAETTVPVIVSYVVSFGLLGFLKLNNKKEV
jgi:SSS family solute:Na+ symporter